MRARERERESFGDDENIIIVLRTMIEVMITKDPGFFYEPMCPREREREIQKKEVVGFLFRAFASGARVASRAQIERERERERSERLFGDDDTKSSRLPP